MVTNQNGFPQYTAPFVNSNGVISQIWYYLLLTLYNRTGGAQGSQPNDFVKLSPAGTLFSYVATVAGNVWISPGSAVTVSINRNGTVINGGTVTQGIFPLSVGDTIILSYSLVPTVYFI